MQKDIVSASYSVIWGPLKKSIAVPVLFSKDIKMLLLALLISGSRWANVMLRWISKPFQSINMFWLCILIRRLSHLKHHWQYFALSYPLCPSWSRSAWLRMGIDSSTTPSLRVSLTMHRAILCFGLPVSPVKCCDQVWGSTSLSRRLQGHGQSVKSPASWNLVCAFRTPCAGSVFKTLCP